jgi:hypothetical protein
MKKLQQAANKPEEQPKNNPDNFKNNLKTCPARPAESNLEERPSKILKGDKGDKK